MTLGDTLLGLDRTVSRYLGDRTRELGEPSDLGSIERPKFGERSDRPCYGRAEKASILDWINSSGFPS